MAEPVPIVVGPLAGSEPLHLGWDRELAESLGGDPGTTPRSPWRLDDEPDWERAGALRLVSAVFDDGRALALAALRPRGAAGHDQDALAHRLEDSDQEVPVAQALLSSEYDADGRPNRLGLELWIEPDAPPLRAAADRAGEVGIEEGGHFRRELTRMTFRLEGARGAGLHELLRPA
jgi:hypothetical protein